MIALWSQQARNQGLPRPGYDLATGWGSPLANTVAALLGARGGASRVR